MEQIDLKSTVEVYTVLAAPPICPLFRDPFVEVREGDVLQRVPRQDVTNPGLDQPLAGLLY